MLCIFEVFDEFILVRFIYCLFPCDNQMLFGVARNHLKPQRYVGNAKQKN